MSSSTISAIVIAVEFALRAVCVYAILRVTLTLFNIRKAEKLEKERDAALTWVYPCCPSCRHSVNRSYCKHGREREEGSPCKYWEFCGKTHQEVYGDGDR